MRQQLGPEKLSLWSTSRRLEEIASLTPPLNSPRGTDFVPRSSADAPLPRCFPHLSSSFKSASALPGFAGRRVAGFS